MAVAAGVFVQVVLVVFVCCVETIYGLQLYGQSGDTEIRDDLCENALQHGAIFHIFIICARAIAGALVFALLVQAERIDNLEKQLGKSLQTDAGRVIDDVHALGVACVVLIDLLVCGIVGMAVNEAYLRTDHPVNQFKKLLGAPEAASREPDFFFHQSKVAIISYFCENTQGMKRFLLAAAAALISLCACAQGVPDPAAHTLKPNPKVAKHSPYKASKNYGKRIAVFGGSLSVHKESDTAKQIWADLLNAEVVTYGVGGAGFAKEQGYTLQKQVEEAGVFDIYVLWASTNDYNGQKECGTWKDYTELDGYDESKRNTQCGGINYCIKALLEKNPDAEIYFFTSLRFFNNEAGNNPFSEKPNKTGKTFADYVQGQKDCCAYYGIPLLDQFNLQGINKFNVSKYYLEDRLHRTEEGYRKIGPVQAAFLANGF